MNHWPRARLACQGTTIPGLTRTRMAQDGQAGTVQRAREGNAARNTPRIPVLTKKMYGYEQHPAWLPPLSSTQDRLLS